MKKITMLLFVVLLSIPSTCLSFNVTLLWDKNPNADYYIVYYGAESGKYTEKTEMIKAYNEEGESKSSVSHKIYRPDLEPGIYYFSVTAYNNFGNTSLPSDEVSKDCR